jgi:hypothetical protein
VSRTRFGNSEKLSWPLRLFPQVGKQLVSHLFFQWQGSKEILGKSILSFQEGIKSLVKRGRYPTKWLPGSAQRSRTGRFQEWIGEKSTWVAYWLTNTHDQSIHAWLVNA